MSGFDWVIHVPDLVGAFFGPYIFGLPDDFAVFDDAPPCHPTGSRISIHCRSDKV